MKYLFTFILLFIGYQSHAQIISDKQSTPPQSEQTKKDSKKKIKPAKEKKQHIKTGTTLYFGVSPAYTFRTLKINDGLFAQPLGLKADEKGAWTTSYEAGIRKDIAKGFDFSIGAAFLMNRETFTYEQKDSVYDYTNTYRQIGFPIRIGYSVGNNIQFFGAIGIIPSAFLSMKQSVTTLGINNVKKTTDTLYREKYNRFLIDAVIDVGIKIKLGSYVGAFILAEGRRQLINNFNHQSAFIRKPYAFGLNVGIEIYL